MMKCPRCHSTHISNREAGMRTCATLGGLIGASSGINAAFRGAQVGVTIGANVGPIGLAAGGLSGALIAGLLSGSAGCALGSLVGRVLDANFLDNRTCLGCGLTFRESSDTSSLNVHVTATATPGPAGMQPHAAPATAADHEGGPFGSLQAEE
jgi:hypothetical protein